MAERLEQPLVLEQALADEACFARLPTHSYSNNSAYRPASEGAEELAAIRHSPQRKRAIALGRPSDAAGECDVVADPRFDIDKTIFGTLTSPVKRWVQSAKLNHVETWHAEPLARLVHGRGHGPPYGYWYG